jgi:hypothetical protein
MLITKKDKRNLKAAEIYKRAKEIRTRKLMLIVDKYYVLILNGFKLKSTSFHLGTCLSFTQLVSNIHINVGQGYAFLFASLCSRLYQNRTLEVVPAANIWIEYLGAALSLQHMWLLLAVPLAYHGV